MSYEHVRRCNLGDLALETGLQHQVLLVLADRANAEGVAWPSVMTLASACYVGRRAVQKTLRRLEERGLLATSPHGPAGCTRYRLTLPPRGEPHAAGGEPQAAPIGAGAARSEAFPVAPAGEPQAAGGEPQAAGDGERRAAPTPGEPQAAGGEPPGQGGRPVVRKGAAGGPPEATGSNREADSTRTAAAAPGDDLGEGEGDDSPEARWAAVVAAHEAGDGPWLELRGKSLRGEWLDVTHGEDAAELRVNLAQWRPNLPSAYVERRDEEREREAAARRRERHQEAKRVEDSLAAAHAAAARQRVEAERAAAAPLLGRLVAWLDRDDQDARDLADCIAAEPAARAALDQIRQGRPEGLARLRAALTGFRLTLLERALAAPAADLATA